MPIASSSSSSLAPAPSSQTRRPPTALHVSEHAVVTEPRPAMFGRTPILPRPAAIRGMVFIKKNHCKGCELCIEFCPTHVLARSKEFNVKGYHYPVVTDGDCINCRLCVTVCPEYAIFAVAAPDRAGSPAAATSPGGQA